MINFWSFITDLGDLAVLIPIWLVMSGYLLTYNLGRTAANFTVMFILVAVSVAVLKMALYSPHLESGSFRLASPSGHVAMSTAIYGSIAIISRHSSREGRVQFATFAMMAALIVAIAMSRVELHMHSCLEAAVGAAVGLTGLTWLRANLRLNRNPHFPIFPLILYLAATVAVFHGDRLGAEIELREIAEHLQGWI
jgi:membrane-associated phospholipid phosphatase